MIKTIVIKGYKSIKEQTVDLTHKHFNRRKRNFVKQFYFNLTLIRNLYEQTYNTIF